jgi:hypothetical protein
VATQQHQARQGHRRPQQGTDQHLQTGVAQVLLERLGRRLPRHPPTGITHQPIHPLGDQAGGAAHAGGVVEHHEAEHGRQGKQGIGKAQLPAQAGGRAGHQG